ncbi:cupin domain-containing protein [Ktedonosporobacter rubrisoli]|nr:cupin domain-containing protein [Ktedonosporobacter rubrisoli]
MLYAVSRADVSPLNNKRGGRMHILLTPKTVGIGSAFLGTLTLEPQEVFTRHMHPYSDECVYIVQGEVTFENDENTIVASAGTGVFIPRFAPHRLQNTGEVEAMLVFFCTPLAPTPEQGHVLLEFPEGD